MPFLFALLFPLLALARTPDSVPNPRHQGSWIVDETGTLSPGEVGELNGRLDALERETSAEFAVVVLKTIDDTVPKSFATDLFRHWGIGKRGKDNGLLLLLVLDQRRAEIEPGYGLEGILPDAYCAQVLRNRMVPEFKAGRMSDGIRAGVLTLVARLEEHADEVRKSPSALQRLRLGPEEQIGFGIAFVVLAFLLIVNLLARLRYRDPFLLGTHLAPGGYWLWGFGVLVWAATTWYHYVRLRSDPFALLPGGIGITVASLFQWLVMSWKRRLRLEPRACSKCAQPMRRIDDQNEQFRYLNDGQATEERILSIDYDVWLCGCGNIRLDPYDGRLSGTFRRCARCATRAERLLRTDRVTSPTEYSTGEEVQHYQCLACHSAHDVRVVLPRLASSSSSSSDGGSSSSSSSDFGGGSSGGGGAGASW